MTEYEIADLAMSTQAIFWQQAQVAQDLSLPKTPSVNSFLLYFTNRSPLQASDIFEKGSVILGAANSRNSNNSRRTRAEHRIH